MGPMPPGVPESRDKMTQGCGRRFVLYFRRRQVPENFLAAEQKNAPVSDRMDRGIFFAGSCKKKAPYGAFFLRVTAVRLIRPRRLRHLPPFSVP